MSDWWTWNSFIQVLPSASEGVNQSFRSRKCRSRKWSECGSPGYWAILTADPCVRAWVNEWEHSYVLLLEAPEQVLACEHMCVWMCVCWSTGESEWEWVTQLWVQACVPKSQRLLQGGAKSQGTEPFLKCHIRPWTNNQAALASADKLWSSSQRHRWHRYTLLNQTALYLMTLH